MLARTALMIAALAAAPLFGLLALAFGQDVNWDLRNYHYYNPYAFLTGRFGWDIAPAQLPTFYNPLLYVPYYGLVNALPPKGVGFALGSLQGLNLVLLAAIAWHVLRMDRPWRRAAAALLTGLAGMSGAGNLAELGTSFFDNVLSLLFLTALLVLVAKQPALAQGALPRALAASACAGLLVGLAVGLKQTMLIYAVGIGLAALTAGGRPGRAIAIAAACGTGMIIGIALGGGYWMWVLWDRYGSPLFPHFNSIFRAPMAPLTDRRDPAYLPHSLWEALAYPLLFAFDSRRVAEIEFRDFRILAAFVAMLLLAVVALARRAAAPRATGARPGRIVLVAAAGTYLVWLPLFSIYRYLIGIELLAPLIVIAAIDRLPVPARPAIAAGVLALVVAATEPGSWGRAPWPGTADYFAVPVPAIRDPAHSIVIMAGWQPASYVIPKYPPELRFIRIQSNFTSPGDVRNRHNDLMQAIVGAHRGPLHVLFTDHEYADVIAALKVYGLRIVWPPCVDLPSNLDQRLVFCPLERLADAASQPAR